MFVPQRNEPDLDDVPADVLESVAVHPVGDVLDIISAALEPLVARVGGCLTLTEPHRRATDLPCLYHPGPQNYIGRHCSSRGFDALCARGET